MPSGRHRGRSPIAARAAAVAFVLLTALPALGQENIDPANDGSQYAYGENVGWLNAEPSGNGGPGVQVGDLSLSGYLWGENIGWISLSCVNTSSCGTVAYGVANDGAGALSGFAWAENAGWIGFSCADTSSCGTAPYGVTIDPASGLFAGQAWGENVGFISFGSTGPNPYRLKTSWSACAAPTGSPTLGLSKAADDTTLAWNAVPLSTAYDIVRGDLSLLRSGGGLAGSTQICVADDSAATAATDPGNPSRGAGYWFLVRPVGCAAGSYDTGVASQSSSRDAGILASGNACD